MVTFACYKLWYVVYVKKVLICMGSTFRGSRKPKVSLVVLFVCVCLFVCLTLSRSKLTIYVCYVRWQFYTYKTTMQYLGWYTSLPANLALLLLCSSPVSSVPYSCCTCCTIIFPVGGGRQAPHVGARVRLMRHRVCRWPSSAPAGTAANRTNTSNKSVCVSCEMKLWQVEKG